LFWTHLGVTCVYIHRKGMGEGAELTKRPIFTDIVTLNVQLIDMVVVHTKLGKTKVIIALLCGVLKVMSYIC